LIYTNDVAALNAEGVYMRAFGVGSNSLEFLPNLQRIDPNAQIFTSSDHLVGFFGGPTASLFEPEHGLPGVTLYLDLNFNGKLDVGEPFVVSSNDDPLTLNEDEAGQYCFGNLTSATAVIRTVPAAGFISALDVDGQLISGIHQPTLPEINFGFVRLARLRLTISPTRQVMLMIERPGGIDHRIEVSQDLQQWFPVTNILDAGPVATWIDGQPAGFRSRYYRAVQRF